ncbi:MAG: FtsX-like permease family protein, partial [Acidobacteriaceae bacterium]|nr:FtsX-like permease family protein [Acidobacteriaceae bacterium]MBV9295119.1 FtsX-like permease family protein [Acidobacteriaceae bacterium]
GPAGLGPPWFYLLGRLQPGLTVKTADPQIQILAEHLANVYRPNLYPGKFTATLQTFADSAVGKFRRTLFTLLAAVGLLLLIACANVANLLLARANVREREFAIRSSLGAGWWRVARQLFVESVALAFLGAAAGCVFAWGALKLLVALLPQDMFPDEAIIGLNIRVLIATVGVAVCTALFFGLVPIIGLRRDTSDALKVGGREHSDSRRGQLRNAFIACEVAISLLLLAGAGVMMRSFLKERAVALGINPQHLLTAEIFLTKGHRTVEQQSRFERELVDQLRQKPGVLDVAATTDFLPFGGALTEFEVPGKLPSQQSEGQFALINPDLFRALRVPLLAGRNLTQADLTGKHKIVVVNQAFVEKFFPGEDPLGKRVQVTTLLHLPEPLNDAWFEIAGVAANFKNRGVRQPVLPEAYVPYTVSGLGGFCLIMRTVGDPQALAKQVEGVALTLDASTVVRHMRTMEEGLENQEYAKPRFVLEIFAVFASLGLLLVSAGLYSILSYTVSQRKREMGIRLALGATPSDVQALVIRTGMRFVLIGIGIGLLASLVCLRFLESQIWGVTTHDPVTLAVVVALLILVGIAACYIPSLTATRVDPALTLRAE